MIISIITPVFNGSAYLKACLENVASQWIEGIEHIIVDGGSKDGSLEILEEYAARFSHIIFISEKDKGQSDAMNKGINMANGSWISFLNVDDFNETGFLKRIMEIVSHSKDDIKILVGNLNIWNADGKLERVNRPDSMEVCHLIADLCEWPFNPSAYFYPASIHKSIGYFPEKEHYAMDYDFILKSAVAGIPYEYYPETWGNFRLLPEAKTSRDQEGNQSWLRSQVLRDYYFEKLNFAQKMKVRYLKVHWYFTLKWRRFFLVKTS